MKIYRLHANKDKVEKVGKKLKKDMIDNNYACISWLLKAGVKFNNQEYNKNDWDIGSNNSIKSFYDIEVGDYIYLNYDGKFYISKVENDTKEYNKIIGNDEEFINNNKKLYIKDLKWKEIPDELYILGCIKDNFIASVTFREIKYPITKDFSKRLYAKITNNNLELEEIKFEFSKDNFYDAIQNSELEDLVYFYLNTKRYNNKLQVIPSTNKTGTKDYEFECKNLNENPYTSVFFQVKKGDEVINLSDNYKGLVDLVEKNSKNKVYLLATAGKIKLNKKIISETKDLEEEGIMNIEIINPNELFEFVKNNINENILSKSIVNCIKILMNEKNIF